MYGAHLEARIRDQIANLGAEVSALQAGPGDFDRGPGSALRRAPAMLRWMLQSLEAAEPPMPGGAKKSRTSDAVSGRLGPSSGTKHARSPHP